MNEGGKSNGSVLPAKRPNNAALPVVEAFEGRGPAEGIAASKRRPGHRAGQAAQFAGYSQTACAGQHSGRHSGKGRRVSPLLHHFDIDQLTAAHWAINPEAATGCTTSVGNLPAGSAGEPADAEPARADPWWQLPGEAVS
jgi:hypothetical protein